VQVFPRHQFYGGAEQDNIPAGDVLPEVHGALGQHQLVEVTDSTYIAFGLGEIHQVDSLGLQQSAQGMRRRGIGREKNGIDPARE